MVHQTSPRAVNGEPGGRGEIRSSWLPWMVALLSTALAIAVRLGLDPLLEHQLPFVSFFVAVTATAYFANPKATVLAIGLGYLAASWLFAGPRHTLVPYTLIDAVSAMTYFAVTGGIAVMSMLMARSRARALDNAAELARRQERLEAESAQRERAQQALHLQSRFATELLDAVERRAVFELLADRIHSVADGAIVSISEFDPEAGTVTVRTLRGAPEDRERLVRVLGRDPVGLELKLPAETRRAWLVGQLAQVPGGLHELLFGQLPQPVCDALARELGLGDVFGMACSYEEDILGTIAVLSRGSGPLRNHPLIEALVAQAGLALKRSRTEEALRKAEERLRLAHELSLDAFTILDAVRDERGAVVDFRWTYVNPMAGKILRHDPRELVGRRLLEVLPGNRDRSDLFERYVRVVQTGEAHDCELPYESEGIQGWFRNMAVRNGDGVAVSFTDITERKRTETALREANERLREADQRKNDFLAVLSHELRNPLTPIANSLHVVERVPPESDQARRALEVIRRQSAQLSRLIDDLLDLTRVSRGKIRLQRRPLALNDLVRQAVDDHRPLFEAAGVRLDLELAPQALTVDGDWSRLAQVVGNLLQNASKFTARGGRTRVSLGGDPATQRAVIRVTDTGAGLSPEMLARLFQPFTQAENTLDRSRGGLGLGLALVKGLVDLHAGSVRAHSAGLGQGAEFVLELPLQVAAPAAVEHAAPARLHPSRRVLIIEDNADAAESLKELLELDGHVVMAASSGPEGLAKARTFRPEVVVCDIGLPGMDGFEVARAFRADPALRRVLLVALSGYAQPSDLQRAREAGFDRHIPKPPNIEQLEELLSEPAAAASSSA